MLTIQDAEKLLIRELPNGSVVKAAIDYEGKFLFIAHFPDVDEGIFDPFFSIDKQSGAFRDFSPQDYPQPLTVIRRLQAVMR